MQTQSSNRFSSLLKNGEQYTVVYDDDPRTMLRVRGLLHKWATDPQLSFDQIDEAAMLRGMREALEKEKQA
jgi:hypothetical protein